MMVNRSVPAATVIPLLSYEDVSKASAWLCNVFGFRERLRIANHRAQLVFGDGAVILTEQHTGSGSHSHTCHSIHVRVADANSHYEHAQRHGARIVQPPTDYPFGERQYTAEDLGGHLWTFSQSIADIDPASWGGAATDLG
jgi:uncharacterized glyoxalase superfamily protein PhnB